jgi:hypothetical protein
MIVDELLIFWISEPTFYLRDRIRRAFMLLLPCINSCCLSNLRESTSSRDSLLSLFMAFWPNERM